MIIDILPAVLFPNDERHISDYYMAGVSLGGHATWLASAHGTLLPRSLLQQTIHITDVEC